MRRLISFLVMLPVLLGAWGVANSTGITDIVADATGVDIPTNLTIPGIDRVFEVSDGVQNMKDRARREAVKALKKEVRSRYGPEVANAIPNDLTPSEARRLLKRTLAGDGADTILALARDAERVVVDRAPKSPGKSKTPPPTKTPAPKAPGPKQSPTKAPTKEPAPQDPQKTYTAALKRLDALAVKGRAPKTGYERSQYGSEWSDAAGRFSWTNNGCDTRNDVLKRDLVKVTFKDATNCKVATGVYPYEPYTGAKNRPFDSTDDDYDNDLDIEHIVPLSWSWQHGAQQWTAAKRAAFANDPINLFAADPSSNRQKGDSGPGAWLPPNKAFRCDYISKFVTVVHRYDLWINSADEKMSRLILTSCID